MAAVFKNSTYIYLVKRFGLFLYFVRKITKSLNVKLTLRGVVGGSPDLLQQTKRDIGQWPPDLDEVGRVMATGNTWFMGQAKIEKNVRTG